MTKREQIVKVLNNYLIQNKQTGGYYSSGVIADEILKALDQPQEEICTCAQIRHDTGATEQLCPSCKKLESEILPQEEIKDLRLSDHWHIKDVVNKINENTRAINELNKHDR